MSAKPEIFNVMGVLLEFLASPDAIHDEMCLIRGTMPPGVVVPLHSHEEPELLYLLEGSLDFFRLNEGSGEWTTAHAGDTVVIPGGIKHALRNSSFQPNISTLITKPKLYEFFQELARPFDQNQQPAPPTQEEVEAFMAATAKYGYWLASPEENSAIGIVL